MTIFPNSSKLLKGSIVLIDPGTLQPQSSIVLKNNLVTALSFGVHEKNIEIKKWLILRR